MGKGLPIYFSDGVYH